MLCHGVNRLCRLQSQGNPMAHAKEVNSIPDRKAAVRARGQACWDIDFYTTMSPDVGAAQAWEHYIRHGQFEDRMER